MYEYIVPRELNIADRIGSFTLVQWAFIASGGLLVMFMFISNAIPFWVPASTAIPIMSLSFFLALFKRYDMPIYEFVFVYLTFKFRPKEMIYGSGDGFDNIYEDYEDEQSDQIKLN